MSADAGDLLQLAAASAIAAGGAALAFAALAVTFSLRRTCAALGRETPAGAFRSPPLVVLAAANARWLPSGPLSLLDAYIAKAGSPAGLRAPELVAVTELTSLSSLVAGLALRTAIGGAVTILLTLAGAALPLLWVHDKVRARQREMVRALPYAADLLTLSVEAGLDFTAALARVADKGRRGALRDELSVAIKELRLGKTREEALRGLAHRVSLPALTSFVQALLHADRMGTPLSRVLRVLATQMRIERTQRAEKLAQEAPVKLLLPLVLCIFPTLFLMLFGPIAYQVFLGGSF